MLNRQVVKDFLKEELREIQIPKDISIKNLVEIFCQFIEDDYYEWLKDNYKAFFNHDNIDWEWIKEKAKGIKSQSTPGVRGYEN